MPGEASFHRRCRWADPAEREEFTWGGLGRGGRASRGDGGKARNLLSRGDAIRLIVYQEQPEVWNF